MQPRTRDRTEVADHFGAAMHDIIAKTRRQNYLRLDHSLLMHLTSMPTIGCSGVFGAKLSISASALPLSALQQRNLESAIEN